MTGYEFDLVFSLASPDDDLEELVERLGEAGCDDAVVGGGRPGRLALAFMREAHDPRDAVAGALEDVREALPDATLIEAAPDLVGITDIAVLLGVSRQNARKLILESAVPPPDPVHGGRPTLWRLAKVLEWLRDEKGYKVPPELVELARATMQVNLAVSGRDADRAVQRALARLVS